MARGSGRLGAAETKKRRLKEALDDIISNPPYQGGFDPITVARVVMERLPTAQSLTKPQARRMRENIDK